MQLTPTEEKAYRGNIQEIVDALTRKQAEQELITEICKQAHEKYGIEKADTRALAKLHYERNLAEERAAANELFENYESLFGTQE